MENLQFILPMFLWFILVSRTAYSIYIRFGPYSQTLRDPFEEHDD
jgi:hypothetical protein